ncbi:MAG: MATE family efflux transporter [Desulfobacterales bacterium]|nr:MATE family efflux transporter [Desulfobacterales bacterium]
MEDVFEKKWGALEFIRFITPSVLGIITISLYLAVDAVFVARYAGAMAMAAVNMIMPLFSLCFSVGIMMAAGASALVGIELGEKRQERAQGHFSLAFFFLAAMAALALLAFQLIGMTPIARMLGATDTLLPHCAAYLEAYRFGLAAIMIQIFFEFFIRLDGKPIWSFYVTLAGGLTNLVLDYILIVHFDMGIRGAGIASAVGTTISALIGCFYFLKRSKSLKFTRPTWDLCFIRNAMVNGSSEMVNDLAAGVKTLVFNLILIRYAGENGVAAMAILMSLFFLMSSFYIGLSMGISPVISYNYGSRNFAKIRELLGHSATVMAAGALVSFLLARYQGSTIIAIFTKGNPQVTALAESGMGIFAFTFLINGFVMYSSSFFTAVNNGKISALIAFLRSFVFTLGFVWFLPSVWGITGIWLSVPAAELATLAVAAWFSRRYWGVYVAPE